MSPVVKFSPEIQLGHLLQAGMLVASMSGWALWGYGQIEAQIADDRQNVALMKQRQSQFDIELKQIGADQRAASTELRASVKEIGAAISDLRGDLKALGAVKR